MIEILILYKLVECGTYLIFSSRQKSILEIVLLNC